MELVEKVTKKWSIFGPVFDHFDGLRVKLLSQRFLGHGKSRKIQENHEKQGFSGFYCLKCLLSAGTLSKKYKMYSIPCQEGTFWQ